MIALDANVLLNLYRYPASARSDMLSALKSLSARLFVPYQAALEYQRNRLATIAAQLTRFDDVRTVMADIEKRLATEFDRLQLRRRHASINPDKLLGEVNTLFGSFKAQLDALEREHTDVVGEDEIRNVLDEILKSRVGPIPEQRDLDLIYSEGKARYEHKCPPGYSDFKKEHDEEPIFISNGLRIERQYGDLLVWKQVLAAASQTQNKCLIFVTDDDKSDWWLRLKSKGQKQLVQEWNWLKRRGGTGLICFTCTIPSVS